VLTYPLDEWGSFYGPIGSQTAATLTAALNHIRRTRRDWDVMELPWVDSEGDDRGETAQALENAGFQATRETWQTSALIDLTVHGTWENYWASRQSHWRNNVRRSEKKLAARGKVTYVRYRSEPGQTLDAICGELFDACEAIARASWQANSSTGNTLVHEEVREFFRDCHVAANQAGSLDINLLLLDGKPVAFNYAYHHQGSVFGLRTGFDAAAARDGAGSVLQARMIEDSFNRGDRTYNLGPGYLECKRYWLTETRPSFRYTHFPAAAPVAQLVRAKRSLQRMWYGQTQRVEPKK
jgi:CelD/BcsL family acetyltransferase involved in cellulose biosynthesis